MTLRQIVELQTVKETPVSNIHESCFRAYWILDKICDMAKAGTPSGVLLEIMEFLMHQPEVRK